MDFIIAVSDVALLIFGALFAAVKVSRLKSSGVIGPMSPSVHGQSVSKQ